MLLMLSQNSFLSLIHLVIALRGPHNCSSTLRRLDATGPPPHPVEELQCTTLDPVGPTT